VPDDRSVVRGSWLTWDRAVQEQIQSVPPPRLRAEGNQARGLDGAEGYPVLGVKVYWEPLALSTDPSNDATFLRYARDHQLAAAGSDEGPVGAPPARDRSPPSSGPALAPKPGHKLLYRLNLTRLEPVTLRMRGFQTVETVGTGILPPSWSCRC